MAIVISGRSKARHEIGSSSLATSLVLPGQQITSEQGYLRGHGTYFEESTTGPILIASLAGQIERVNKLISVKSIHSRYLGEIGDLVVGRISAVESKRWKCDINGQKDAILQLASVNLPGGVQRMRTYEDQLQMRSLYTEYDLISAEVQNIASDGTPSLHTRSLKYGKLENGQLIIVPASLIKRLPQHYVTLPWGVDVILGRNGYIWITRCIPEEWKSQDPEHDEVFISLLFHLTDSQHAPLAETLQRLKIRHATTPLSSTELLQICRVRNSIEVLSIVGAMIHPESIIAVYKKSESLEMPIKDMLHSCNILLLTQDVIEG